MRLKAAEFGEKTQNIFFLFWLSRSFKVTDVGTNRKLIYDFLLVINTNLPPIFYRFEDTVFQMLKNAIFGYSSCV